VSVGGLRFRASAAHALVLVSPAVDPFRDPLRWLTEVLSHKLDQLVGRDSLTDQERRLRRERTLLYGIINAVTDPLLLTDTEGRLVVANSRAEMLFSATPDVSEGRRRAIELNNMFFSAALSRTALEDGEPARRELALVDPTDGSDLLFELLSAVVNDPREGTGIVSVLRNISDLRRATQEIEENYARLRVAEMEARAERDRLNLIIDSVVDPILVADHEGKISLMNAPAERLFTADGPVTDAQKRAVRNNDAHIYSFISGLLSTGGEMTRRGELTLADPGSRSPVPVEAIAGKMVSELGELTAIVTILHDRTEAVERVRLYEQLKRASHELEAKVQAATAELARQNELLRRQALELEQASAAKSQFLANVSHELRTPLNAILGYAAMTQHGVAGAITPAQRRNLNRIESNGRHLLALINEILDITRIEAGRMPLQVTRFSIQDLLAEVTSEMEPIIVRSKLAVSLNVPAGLASIRSDRQKVKQILVNLLSNALKFTHHGGVTIAAELTARNELTLTVADTGIGIAETDLAWIFDDFRQVDSTPRRAYGGTGLGLAICRRLASMLRGMMTVESTLARGSVFTLQIPTELRK
jgi:signal transduction histidine kinase